MHIHQVSMVFVNYGHSRCVHECVRAECTSNWVILNNKKRNLS